VEEQSGNITRLEWITCPECSQTFQIAVPAEATNIRVRSSDYRADVYYCFRVRCINSSCRSSILIETDLLDL
jgi:hypothetical protein